MDKLHAMSVFVEIAERGSLTAAAEQLGKSLPTIVRLLASLEESLQVRLFNRTTRRIALTREGRLYLDQCRRILADVAEAECALTREQAEPRGIINVTAPVRFGEMHVAPAVTRFLATYPKARVNLLLLDRVVDLLEEGIDVAVRIAPLEDSSLIARPVAETRQVVCASPELLARVGEPEHPGSLATLPCVSFTGLSPGGMWQFPEAGKRHSVAIEGLMSCNQIGASLHACARGLGFGRFFCYQVRPWLERGELVRVLQDFEPDPLPVSLVYPHARLMSARVRTLLDWLVDDIRASLGIAPDS